VNDLPLLAEISIAYVGFISIFLIFARRDGRFEKHDSLRVEALFTASFMGVFLSLVPIALSYANISEATVLRIPSALGAIASASIMLSLGKRQFSLPAESRAKIGLINNLYAWPAGSFIVLSLSSIALGVNPVSAEFLYLTVIVLFLGISTSNFVTIARQKLN